MTREEAKRRLLDIERCTPIHTREDARDFKALEMAIESLSTESCEELEFIQPHKKVSVNLEVCTDAISRQAVLDLIYNSWKHNGVGGNYGELSIDALKALPPVTPKQTDALDKIIAEIKEQYGGCGLINDGLDMALSIIDKYMAESEGADD